MYPIHAYGDDDQKQRWLPGMAKGEIIGCFGLTEPDFGSFVSGMVTRAERKNGGWVLNGTKRWITNGTLAQIAIIWATTDEGVRGFVVETDRPGFEARDIKGKFSLRASVTSELFLQDVEVPEANRLPGAKGLGGPLGCLNQARYGIAWGATGAAMACYDEVVKYTRDRIVQGGPLAGKQLTQQKLAFMLTEITKAQLLALQVGRLKDAGRLHHTMVSMIKRNNVDMALQIAREARDLLGANGIVDDYHAMRHMLNLETVRTYEGTHDIHTLILGEHITGMRAI
jgi:glutaryl-CoA dehydrogenase